MLRGLLTDYLFLISLLIHKNILKIKGIYKYTTVDKKHNQFIVIDKKSLLKELNLEDYYQDELLKKNIKIIE